MKFVAAVLAILGSACGPTWDADKYQGDPQENAIAAFTRVYGAPSSECAQRALDMQVDYMPVGDVRLACHDPKVVGCVDQRGDDGEPAHAYVGETEPPGVLAHETLHVLMFCAEKWADNKGHKGIVWHSHGIDDW